MLYIARCCAPLSAGNAGSNTAADHIAVLTAAIAQVPAPHRRKLLIRADGAGASHDLLDWITALDAKRGRSVEYSVGYAITDTVRDAIAKVPNSAAKPAITATGQAREHGDVVEITGMLGLSTWPTGMRVIVRGEHPHPGAALSLPRSSAPATCWPPRPTRHLQRTDRGDQRPPRTPTRRHSALGQINPVAFEHRLTTAATEAAQPMSTIRGQPYPRWIEVKWWGPVGGCRFVASAAGCWASACGGRHRRPRRRARR